MVMCAYIVVVKAKDFFFGSFVVVKLLLKGSRVGAIDEVR